MDVLTLLSQQLQADMKRFEEDCILGKAKDHGEYKYACGIYRGLLMANAHIAEAVERMRGGDDEEDK